jgi:hypothetical protein
MQSHSHRPVASDKGVFATHAMHPPRQWKKLITFLALIAIPAICTALYVS